MLADCTRSTFQPSLTAAVNEWVYSCSSAHITEIFLDPPSYQKITRYAESRKSSQLMLFSLSPPPPRCLLHTHGSCQNPNIHQYSLYINNDPGLFESEYKKGQTLLPRMELDCPAGRNIQSSSLHRCSAAAVAGQHVDKLLLHIISLFFLPKSNNSVVIILLFRQVCRIAAEDLLQEREEESIA